MLLLASFWAAIFLGGVCFLGAPLILIYFSFGAVLGVVLNVVLAILGLSSIVLDWFANHVAPEGGGAPAFFTFMLFLSTVFWTVSFFIAGYFTLWWRHHKQKKAE